MCYVTFTQIHRTIRWGGIVILLLIYNLSGPAKTFAYKLALNTKFRRKFWWPSREEGVTHSLNESIILWNRAYKDRDIIYDSYTLSLARITNSNEEIPAHNDANSHPLQMHSLQKVLTVLLIYPWARLGHVTPLGRPRSVYKSDVQCRFFSRNGHLTLKVKVNDLRFQSQLREYQNT